MECMTVSFRNIGKTSDITTGRGAKKLNRLLLMSSAVDLIMGTFWKMVNIA